MNDRIGSNRRRAALFKRLSNCVAGVCVISSMAILGIGLSGPSQPDEVHVHRHDARGAVYYLSDTEDRAQSVAGWLIGLSFGSGVTLTLISMWFKRRETQEAQKQLLIDEFGPTDRQ